MYQMIFILVFVLAIPTLVRAADESSQEAKSSPKAQEVVVILPPGSSDEATAELKKTIREACKECEVLSPPSPVAVEAMKPPSMDVKSLAIDNPDTPTNTNPSGPDKCNPPKKRNKFGICK